MKSKSFMYVPTWPGTRLVLLSCEHIRRAEYSVEVRTRLMKIFGCPRGPPPGDMCFNMSHRVNMLGKGLRVYRRRKQPSGP
jgi:hypothetical protein